MRNTSLPLADVVNTDYAYNFRERGLHHILKGIDDGSKEVGVYKPPDRGKQAVKPRHGFRQFELRIVATNLLLPRGIPRLLLEDLVDFFGEPTGNGGKRLEKRATGRSAYTYTSKDSYLRLRDEGVLDFFHVFKRESGRTYLPTYLPRRGKNHQRLFASTYILAHSSPVPCNYSVKWRILLNSQSRST